jgi:pyruvate carboxylase
MVHPERRSLGAVEDLRQADVELAAANVAAWAKPAGYRHYEDCVVERFVAKSADNGMDVFRVFDALNDVAT